MNKTLMSSKKLETEPERVEAVVILVGMFMWFGVLAVLCMLPILLFAIFRPAPDSLGAEIIGWGSFAVWIVLFALIFASLARDSMGDEQSGAGSQDITGQADLY